MTTTTALRHVKVAPKGMGLNDFVAQKEGFFAAEGLDVEFDWKTFRGTQSSWKGLDYFQRPQDRPYTEGNKDDVIQGACVWGTICNASAGMGRVRDELLRRFTLGDFRAAGFENPHARRTSRTCRSRSACAPAAISTCRTGWKSICRSRTSRRSTPAASARGSRRCSTARSRRRRCCRRRSRWREQLGLRKIIEDRFKTLWWVPDSATPEVVTGYINALERAEKALEADLEKYLPLWEIAVPPEFRDRTMGLLEIRPRREIRARADPAAGFRRGVQAGRALGPRAIRQGSQRADAVLSVGVTSTDRFESHETRASQ